MKLFHMIDPMKTDGKAKTQKEILNDVKTLLLAYKKENVLLQDKLYDLNNNVIPEQQKTIKNLTGSVEKLNSGLKYWKDKYNNRGWFS